MSAAIRKRSWEEHVTQKTGQPFNSVEYDTACHHGLVVDSLQASMENDASLNVDHKEKCASLPDCCHGSEPRDFPGRPTGQISKEADESDSQEGEEKFLSLEASTETLVHVSDDDTDSDSHLTNGTRIITPQTRERDSNFSPPPLDVQFSHMQTSQRQEILSRQSGPACGGPSRKTSVCIEQTEVTRNA